ncbi:Pectinesterase inhibitor [Corchorus olitorius]|uniref:Pectinesterase inhibitor n=1 Tax=Corchorus olitorius TaxID=93759 RepID=A0A1R3K814_9ROSI|nr:Pectinesterase inhibitor [Corchorus olitorius]
MAKPDFLTIFLLLLVLNKNFSLAATAQDAKQTNSTPSETNSKTKTQIQGCAHGFQHAIRRINDGIAAFDKKNYEEAYSKIDTIFESLNECKDKRLDMFQNLNDVTDAFANVVLSLLEKLVPAFDKY